MPNYNSHSLLLVSGQLVKLLNPEKSFFGTVILITAAGFAGQKLAWLWDKPSTARIRGLEVPQTSGFCFQVSRTGSVAPHVGLGWEVVKHRVIPRGSCPTTGLGHWTALASCWRSNQLTLLFSPYSCNPANSGWGCSAFPLIFWGEPSSSTCTKALLCQISYCHR